MADRNRLKYGAQILDRIFSTLNMKKALKGAGCSKADRGAKNVRPTADPLPGGAGRPKFTQLEKVTTFIYKPSLVKIDLRNFELSW